MKKNNEGFTLIELLVVIAIIGILAVVAVPALFKNINKAKIADVESDYSAIRSAVLAEYAENGKLPYEISNQSFIDKYVDNGAKGTPLGGFYHIVPDYNDENGNPYINFGAYKYDSKNNSFDYVKSGELQNEFKAILAIRPYDEQNKADGGIKIKKDEFLKLGKDLGYQNVFVSNKNFAKDKVEIYIGLIPK
ncbi:MAG: pilin [Paraclostridium sp.]|uniref:pilin n=1 Tax=Paraclostridium sp. TaxID=2023273 RepID=UPI003F3ED1E9